MNRERAIETARAVLSTDGTYSHADAVALALYVLEVNQGVEDVFSPSTSSCGGGESPAAPDHAPVSTKRGAGSPARNLGGPSGPEFAAEEPDTVTDLASSNAPSVPTINPMAGMTWQDEKIATWLEGHADGYHHSGSLEVARVLRKKAAKVRRREYLEK